MVEIRVIRAGSGALVFSATGHAGWAEHGKDVVCAAVSTLLQAAWLGLERVAGVEVDGRRESGRLDLSWSASPDRIYGGDPVRWERAQAIAETVALSLEHIAEQFPGHVRVTREP